MATTRVQVRFQEKLVRSIDQWIANGRFSSRSEAVNKIVALYDEREHTRKFYRMLIKQSREARKNPKTLISLANIS